MQKGQTQVLILAGIVILIVLAGGIFYLGRITLPRQDSSGQAAPKPQTPVTTSSPQPRLDRGQPSPTPQPTTSPASDTNTEKTTIESNWKEYISISGSFAIKYPPDKGLIVFEGKEGGIIIAYPNSDVGVFIGVSDNPTRLTAIDWAKKSFLELSSAWKPADSLISEFKPRQVAGVSGIESVVRLKDIGNLVSNSIFVPTPNQQKMLNINVTSTTSNDLPDQILSTFRFK